MTYDFGLKQISFHYLLMFAFLLAPDARRLANVLVLNRPAEPSSQLDLFATPRANRIARVAQVAFGIYLIGMFTWVATRSYYAPGGPGEPRSPLYGIWNIDEMSVDEREPARRPQRLRSPLAPHHLRHAVRRRLSTHGRFVRALRGEHRHEQPRHRADQAQRRHLARVVHVRSAVVRSTRARGDDGRLQAAASAAAGGPRHVPIAEQPVPVG